VRAIIIVNLEGYGKGGLGTLAYHLHELLVTEHIPSVLIASDNPRELPNVHVVKENDYSPVPRLVRQFPGSHRLILGRNELAALSYHLSDLVLIPGGTAYLQAWLETWPGKTTLDFLRLKRLPEKIDSPRVDRERVALDRATRILSPPGLNRKILEKAYPECSHKISSVHQIFRTIRPNRPWEQRGIDLIAVAQWKDRGVDRDVKGYRFLMEVLRPLREKRLRVVIVGDVPFPIDGVEHTGWLDHESVLGLMENARIFVSPSRNECYSQAIVEALQLGCNVVLSRNAAPYEFCHPGLIAHYHPESFSRKIEKALTKRFSIKPLPSPKDSLRLLLSALEA
jgi:glycosyltransferase involved in cell wall biosynthesis